MKAERPAASLHGPLEERVLILAPGGRDAAVAEAILGEAELSALACADALALVQALEQGAGLVCLTEEALKAPAVDCLTRWIAQQPPWSDLPVIVMTHRSNAERGVPALRLSEIMGNVMLLERPFHSVTLVGLARTCLRARRRQYDARQNLVDLQAAAVQLEDADHHKNEFLAMLAHELRNPLAPLTNAHRLLERTEPLTERGRAVLALAQRQTHQLHCLVDDLLEISRITLGKIEIRPEPMSVAVAVHAAVESVAPLTEQRAHSIEVHVPPAPVRMQADPVRIAQVLENLLTNASKYTPEGGAIRVEVEAQAEAVEIRVADNGVGIEPAKLGELFKVFHQINATIDRAQGGLGIGLALVKRLVELHGGTVTADSQGLGKGATFTVRLPRAAAAGSDAG